MKPFVSISCITYNHENFITKAIESFLIQKTSFPIEILIHDDASTDRTADIIRKYETKHPDLIKPIYQTENQYSKGIKINIAFQFPRAEGKYIAFCEGDDYWTDPYKLQKQVDFLEANENYIGCGHRVEVLKNGELVKDTFLSSYQTEASQKDLAKSNFLRTQSMVFRLPTAGIPVPPEGIAWGDHFMWLYLTQFGKVRILDEVMAVYREHSGGVFCGIDKAERALRSLKHWQTLRKYFKPLQAEILEAFLTECLRASYYSFLNKRFSCSFTSVCQFFIYGTNIHLVKLLFNVFKKFVVLKLFNSLFRSR